MFVLEKPIQQRIAYKKVPGNLWNQEEYNSLSCKWGSSINIKNIKLFLQNVQKNKILTNTILETNKNFNIIFIQELLWSIICSISSSSSKKEEKIVGAPNHLNWIIFFRNLLNNNNYFHVISYINIHLINLCFSFWKEIFNHRDICCLLSSSQTVDLVSFYFIFYFSLSLSFYFIFLFFYF